MNTEIYTIFNGTGSYIPKQRIPNKHFLKNEFYDSDGNKIDKPNKEIIQKFEEITGIKERRYVWDYQNTSDISYIAAKNAFKDSGIDKESLDYIIVAHNFGDVRADNKRSEFVPTLASRVKHKLEIENPHTLAYDLPFGCPGWLQGVIQADYYIKSGDAKRVMVIGAETLSRIYDPHDRDGMIYADGAGATILEAILSKDRLGILSHAARSDTKEHAYMLWMDKSYNPDYGTDDLLLKMHGHELYKYALRTVPLVVKEALDKAGVHLNDVRKVLIHQANEKMDEAILQQLFRLYGKKKSEIPKYIMPMTISWLGNSSVATLPTMLDLIFKGKLNDHDLREGDIIVFASVGAGMNINAAVYKMPLLSFRY
ncbi:3-oxoacyl-ACP synthase [Euryarchaeota archaeon SM23-78]|nr:MAG: 3-oxoacyl-ACP synthase [Euryarchaeota archaeon SM23-78]MBW3000769.1 ketoacyl-ACP synthase III [Candidatus Woesearchaeota archaeon]